MSDSSMRVNPSIEEPSNWIQASKAFSNWERGILTFLMTPRMSVNCSRMKRTFSALHTFRISGLDRPGPAASNLRIFAFGILLSFFCTLRRILMTFRKESMHLYGQRPKNLQSCTHFCANGRRGSPGASLRMLGGAVASLILLPREDR